MLSYRLTYGASNVHRYAATDLSGQNGWIALGSLLFAIEANDFVLTLASTWSRLMNELRLYNDTMIDLLYDELDCPFMSLSTLWIILQVVFAGVEEYGTGI